MKVILLIENDTDTLENLDEIFQLKGYKTLLANNGKTGVEKVVFFKPNLIICDILIPKMDGYEVFRLLLGTHIVCQIPFVFSTCLFKKTERQKSFELGGDGYIVKPYDIKTLLKITESCLKSGSRRSKCTH